MTDVATVTINDTCFELRYSIKDGAKTCLINSGSLTLLWRESTKMPEFLPTYWKHTAVRAVPGLSSLPKETILSLTEVLTEVLKPGTLGSSVTGLHCVHYKQQEVSNTVCCHCNLFFLSTFFCHYYILFAEFSK